MGLWGNSENTANPYLLTAVVRIVCIRECESDSFFVRPRLPAYASNCLTAAGTSVMEGTPMTGVLMATFGDYLNASFGAWLPSALFRNGARRHRTPPLTSDVDMGNWSWAPLLTRGESGIFAKKEHPRNTGIRIHRPDTRSSRSQCEAKRKHT